MTGRTLSHYEVLEKLGAGGMGEVYRARDTKLGRDVALKVLPRAFAEEPQRLARFRREAHVLASLNHPNIAAIYGLEEAGGVHFLVLELVPGEILAGPVEPEEALRLCRQITEALEEAHEKGVVHRDLKPANVKVTPDGRVKVLDFGLAKALATETQAADASHSPTLTIEATRHGVLLGTAAYMSPEQARMRPIDKRADIWAFCCILYELLTGRQAFVGETVLDTLTAVTKSEPDWSRLPATTPPGVVRLLRRCLEKDPKARLRDIADTRLELEEAADVPSPVRPLAESPVRRLMSWAVAALLAALAFAGGLWWNRSEPAESWRGELLGGPAVAFGPRVSPDGQMLAFQALVNRQTQVAVMKPETGNWTVLTRDRSRGSVSEMCWSRDGAKIYFDRFPDVPRGVFSVPVLGGEERLVLEDAAWPQSLPDGSLVVMRINPERKRQLYRFWPETGRLEALPALASAESYGPTARVFSDGKEVAFFGKPIGASGPDALDRLYVLDLVSGRSRRLAPGAVVNLQFGAFPFGVHSDGRWVLTDLPDGSLHRIVGFPRDGAAGWRTLLTLTMTPWFVDVGPDGSVYLDQLDRPPEALRFGGSGGEPERVAISTTTGYGAALPLPDGRVLFPAAVAGRTRLLAAATGNEPVPLVDTREETTPPVTLVGQREVALLIGTPPDRSIAIVSLADGRIVRRLKGGRGANFQNLAASSDGRTLYYAAGGSIWTLPSTDGEPRKVHAGDGVAVSPQGQDLIIKLIEKDGVRLVRLPASGGQEQPIPFRSQFRPTINALASNAVGRDGRVLLEVISADSWFYEVGVLDPRTGQLEKIPVKYDGDLFMPGWTADGRIAVMGQAMRANLWRFRRSADPAGGAP